VRDQLINLTISANEDSLAYPPQIDAKLAFLAMDVGSADSAPTEAEQLQFEKLKRQSGELLSRWDDLQRRDLAAFQKLTAEGNLSTVVVPPAGQAETPGKRRRSLSGGSNAAEDEDALGTAGLASATAICVTHSSGYHALLLPCHADGTVVPCPAWPSTAILPIVMLILP
jgi:hypothetical protein